MGNYNITKPGDRPNGGIPGFRLSGNGVHPASNVTLTFNNTKNSNYCYGFYYGPSTLGDWSDFNNVPGSIWHIGPIGLPIFIYPQFMSITAGPAAWTNYDKVDISPDGLFVTCTSNANPDANIVITVADAGSGGPPEA